MGPESVFICGRSCDASIYRSDEQAIYWSFPLVHKSYNRPVGASALHVQWRDYHILFGAEDVYINQVKGLLHILHLLY